ncbi:hypothetical protein [Zhongshania sp.]|uniref:hypothetical protein n=1 Tax=Zhongshania sp. TaxID=1971902 RepID=UPI003562A9BB
MVKFKALAKTRMAAIERTRARIKALQGSMPEARMLNSEHHYRAHQHEIKILKALTRGSEA